MTYYPNGYDPRQPYQAGQAYGGAYYYAPFNYGYAASVPSTKQLWDNYYKQDITKKKREFWVLSNLTGLTVLFFLLLQFGVVLLIRAAAPTFPDNPVSLHSTMILLSLVSILLPFFLLSFYAGSRSERFDPWPTQKIGFGQAFALFCVGIGVTYTGNIIVTLISRLLDGAGVDIKPPTSAAGTPSGLVPIILVIVSNVILPALCEEFAIRGVLLSALRRHGDRFAIYASATVFAIMHFNLLSFPFAFLMGIISAYIVIYTNNIWISVAIHATNNFVATFAAYINNMETPLQYVFAMVFNVIIFGALIAGLVIFIVYLSKRNGFLKTRRSDYVTRRSTSYLKFCFSPMMIAVWVVFFLLAFNVIE